MDGRIALARQIRDIFETTAGVVDVDWYVEDDQPKQRIRRRPGEGRAARHHRRATSRARCGSPPPATRAGLLHVAVGEGRRADQRAPGPRVALRSRTHAEPEDARPRRRAGAAAANWCTIETAIEDKSIYHKNLMPVTYVTADVAGAMESPVYAILEARARRSTRSRSRRATRSSSTRRPCRQSDDAKYAMKWDGEWHITYEVFRDLGLAFAAVLVLIYVLVVGWFQSFMTPLVIMAAIPFSLVGILPAHGMLGAFFTATSMIGFIAGAGIVVRNSIILVDFVELRLTEGMPLDRGGDRCRRGALPPDDADGRGGGRRLRR